MQLSSKTRDSFAVLQLYSGNGFIDIHSATILSADLEKKRISKDPIYLKSFPSSCSKSELFDIFCDFHFITKF
jgi:hypothetical protein